MPQKALDENEVCFKEHCFQVEVAFKEDQQARGLQFRKSMAEDEGMIFIFNEERRYSFWMKDTFIPLDMIWLNYAQKVVSIEKNVPPCKEDPCKSYRPKKRAYYVLEINAGLSDQLSINVGDYADIRLKPMEQLR